MQVLLLGPVELRDVDGSVVRIGGARRRAVLAVLALNANREVTVDRLLELVWGEDHPPTAKAALQGHVSQLRALLDDSLRLETTASGYQLRTEPGHTDVQRMERLLADAGTAGGPAAVPLLREALGLWRGRVLTDCDSPKLRETEGARLEDVRLRATEALAEHVLADGQGPSVTDELTDRLAENPLRESLVRLVMLCLAQEGRPAEAIAVYEEARARLLDELGLTPGSALQEALVQVSAAPPTTTAAAPAAASDRPAAPTGEPLRTLLAPTVVDLLPREPRGFTGRDRELARLGELARPGGDGAVLVAGPPGVGKSALVVHWARRNAERFPDGRILVNLRGFDETEPLRAEEALAIVLRALGVDSREVPTGLDEAAARYRAELAGRRVLLVLDNARSGAQVLPLLPDESGCVAVVTSRHRLMDLEAGHGVPIVALEALEHAAARDVLAGLVGPARMAAEPAAAQRVVELCDGLPLAIRIAGARLAVRPDWPLSALVGELADERSRLATLATTGTLSIEAALELTVRTLPAGAAELFRLLGVHPAQQVGIQAAAALADTDRRAARQALDVLHLAHLVQETAPGRFARHDLVRIYARQLAEQLPASERDAALARLVDHYLATAAAAVAPSRPDARRHVPAPRPGDQPPAFGGAAGALTWFRTEEPAIRDLVTLTCDWRRPAFAGRLVENAGYLYNDAGLFREWEQVASRALAALTAEAEDHNWPHLYSNHSLSLGWLGRHEEALQRSERAAELAEGDDRPLLRHRFLAMKASFLPDADAEADAVEHIKAAIEGCRQLGDGRLLSQALNNLADSLVVLGRPEDALEPVEEALHLLAGREFDPFTVVTTKTYAQVLHALGRTPEALVQIERMRELGRAQGSDAHAEFDYAHFMGQVHYDAGRTVEAHEQWERALRLAREQGRSTGPVKAVEDLLARARTAEA
ncbi:BTAD domain-containing putative transcriptional regulator [Kitasatospora sp. NPDC049285]|uniref:AfsR/SARP family transcriptional regulator n=1 Tax=Kitasatospora sp. NPDC049285 TaxID=3157096 RepID=UPI003429A3C5